MKTGSLFNQLMDNTIDEVKPEVGLGVTILSWTDRHAGTIINVSADKKKIIITQDIATRTGDNGMSDDQSYSYKIDPLATPMEYSLRKNGKYYRVGDNIKDGLSLLLGVRREYYDYSF